MVIDHCIKSPVDRESDQGISYFAMMESHGIPINWQDRETDRKILICHIPFFNEKTVGLHGSIADLRTAYVKYPFQMIRERLPGMYDWKEMHPNDCWE
jgi:hypothetical protein